jgi:hypothetical protein
MIGTRCGSRENSEPSGTTFSFGCTNVTKWSVPSLAFSCFFPLGPPNYNIILVIISFDYN